MHKNATERELPTPLKGLPQKVETDPKLSKYTKLYVTAIKYHQPQSNIINILLFQLAW